MMDTLEEKSYITTSNMEQRKKEFRAFIELCNNYNDPLFQKAMYYEGLSGLELYNSDAIDLLMDYNRGISRKYSSGFFINFKIGNSFFQDETYDDAELWFGKLSAGDFRYFHTERSIILSLVMQLFKMSILNWQSMPLERMCKASLNMPHQASISLRICVLKEVPISSLLSNF